jgi:hypothetical protein
MKLVSKERVGSNYKKKYDAAKPPYQRLMERDDIPQEKKLAVIDLKTKSDLMDLKILMDAAIDILIKTTETFAVAA